jgi:hypothetical protein
MTRIFAVLLAVFASQAQAAEGTGVGVVLGSPNGLTARHWVTERQSLEGSLGWSISRSRFQVNANYLWSHPGLLEVGGESFDLFYGAGLSIRTKSGRQDGEVVFGPRIPVGASYGFTDPNIELFGQLALNLGIIPASDLYADVNLGIRFYF